MSVLQSDSNWARVRNKAKDSGCSGEGPNPATVPAPPAKIQMDRALGFGLHSVIVTL